MSFDNMTIDVKLALFYVFSAVLVTSSCAVVLARHPVKAVLSLVLAFVVSTGLWMLVHAEFLALTLIVVYVGAVMVLFLFVVMMLDVDVSAMYEGFNKYFPLALLLSIGFFGVLYKALLSGYFAGGKYASPNDAASTYSNIQALGMELYTNYIYSFELAAALLMVAIIAAIGLAFRGAKLSKKQDIRSQVQVTKASRLKIVNVDKDK